MKSLSVLGVLFIAFGCQFSFAGPGGSGGGDLSCQSRIEDIRNDISDWITKGGSKNLDFKDTQTSLPEYNQKMQKQVALTRIHNQGSISCTDNPELVKVEGADKICISTPDAANPKILCYRGIEKDGRYIGGLMGQSEEEQYRQIHHEFAVLSSIEDRSGAPTNYPLSKQIAKYLQDKIIKFLALKPQTDYSCSPTSPISSISAGDKLIFWDNYVIAANSEEASLSPCRLRYPSSPKTRLISNGTVITISGPSSSYPGSSDYAGTAAVGFSFIEKPNVILACYISKEGSFHVNRDYSGGGYEVYNYTIGDFLEAAKSIHATLKCSKPDSF